MTWVKPWLARIFHLSCLNIILQELGTIYSKTCLSGHLSITDTFESPKLLVISLHAIWP